MRIYQNYYTIEKETLRRFCYAILKLVNCESDFEHEFEIRLKHYVESGFVSQLTTDFILKREDQDAS